MQSRPRKPTLNYLNRLGVFGRLVLVLSSFWMVGGTLYTAKDVKITASRAASFMYVDCMELNTVSDTPVDCEAARKQTYAENSAADIGGPVVVGVVISSLYLALALIVIIPGYYSIRWIIAGGRR